MFNTTNYQWDLSDGIIGSSDSSSIFLDFDESFKSGQISVSAVNDGFGISEPAVLEIQSETQTSISEKEVNPGFWIHQNEESIQIFCSSEKKEKAHLKIYNSVGRLLFSDEFQLNPGMNTKSIDKNILQSGIIIFDLSVGTKRNIQKVMF